MGGVVRPSAILFEQSKQTEPCESLKQAGNGLYRDCQSLNVNQQRGGPHPDLKQGFDLSALSASKGGVQSAPIGTPPQRYLRYYVASANTQNLKPSWKRREFREKERVSDKQ